MRQLASGESSALQELSAHFVPSLMRYAYSILRDPHLAQDMVQQTITTLWIKGGQWKPQARLSSWLFTILRNQCLQYLRKHKPQLYQEFQEEQLPLTPDQPQQLLDTKERDRHLNKMIAQMPERQQSALLLKYGQELSQKEAASVLGLGEKAFESLLGRARKKLKSLMERYQNV